MNLKRVFFDIGWSLVDETQAHRARLLELQEWLRLININLELNELVAKCEEAATAFAVSPFWEMLEGFGLSGEQIDSAKQSFAYAKANEYLYPGVPDRTKPSWWVIDSITTLVRPIKRAGIPQEYLQGFSRFQQPRISLERPDLELSDIKELGLVV